MNRKAVSLFLVFGLFVLLIPFGFQRPAPTQAGDWQDLPVWSDEFNLGLKTPVNASNWVYDVGQGPPAGPNQKPGWGNFEKQYYTNRLENVYHDGTGNLVIEARRENFGSGCAWYNTPSD